MKYARCFYLKQITAFIVHISTDKPQKNILHTLQQVKGYALSKIISLYDATAASMSINVKNHNENNHQHACSYHQNINGDIHSSLDLSNNFYQHVPLLFRVTTSQNTALKLPGIIAARLL